MRIGFIGTGLMGAPMAHRLLDAGHDLAIWNRSDRGTSSLLARGATRANYPSELMPRSEVIAMCLHDAAGIESVVFGLNGLAYNTGAKFLIDHASICPEQSRAFAERFAERTGASWIDAPVSGGVSAAELGSLAVMMGGNEAAVKFARRVVEAYASTVSYLGPSGSGQLAKLCSQTIIGTSALAIGEAVALGIAAGIAPNALLNALTGGLADGALLQLLTPGILDAHLPARGKMETLLKDLSNALHFASSAGLDLPGLAQSNTTLKGVVSAGFGSLSVARLGSLLGIDKERRGAVNSPHLNP